MPSLRHSSNRITLRLDPWPADFEAAIALEPGENVPPNEVDAFIEQAQWQAIRPDHPGAFCSLCFIDGVRRVEARVLSDSAGQLVHGLFGSLATGAVCFENGKSQFTCISVGRFLVLGAGLSQSERLPVGYFEAASTAANSPQDVLLELQGLMRHSEAALGEALVKQDRCVFADGPLSYFTTMREVVGVIKRIILPYVGPTEFSLVERLATGERTPLFSIQAGGYQRFSCFLRLATGRAIDHPLAGIVRIEIGAAVGLEKARALADFAACQLPRFASTSMRDPRAPQNLLPVGALEDELRRRLGDALLVRRSIERRLAELRME